MTRVVIDTNVLIDGFKDDYSYEKKIIDAVIHGEIEAFANKQTIRENHLLLSQVVNNETYRKELESFFAQVGNVVNRRQIRIVRDPEDNKILESAVESKSEYLITSDNDLLTLVEFQGIKMVRPQQFWAQFKDEGMDLWKQWSGFITGQKRGESSQD